MEVNVLGEIAAYDAQVLAISALKGAIEATVEDDVTYVNAPKLAEERGMSAIVKNDPNCEQFRSSIQLKVAMASGTNFVVEGTLVGIRKVEKIVSIDGFGLDVSPGKHMIFLRYMDKPGVIGSMGGALGKAGVNIAGMQVSRREIGGMALMALTVDDAVSDSILEEVKKTTGADLARTVNLEK
jgi:D-3-phosphoglycerate dehydrogenase